MSIEGGVMNDTTVRDQLFDVKAECERLIKNSRELCDMGFVSTTAARKSQNKIRKWARSNLYLQIGTI